jgi:hypothetical protein
MSVEVLIEVIGLVGVASYVLSYALLQLGIIKGNGYIYPLMNLAGASFVAVSLLNNWNFWQLMISIAFGTFSIIGMTRVYLANRKLSFTDEESTLYEQRFAMLTRGDMRRVFQLGTWVDGDTGATLTHQGKPVDNLAYLLSGGVDIIVGSQKITEVGPGEFIGEMASLDGGPASATVKLNQPTRYFAIPSDALRAFRAQQARPEGAVGIRLCGQYPVETAGHQCAA